MYILILFVVVLLLAYNFFPKMKLLWRRDIVSAKLDLVFTVTNLPGNFTVQDMDKTVATLMNWVQKSRELFLPQIVYFLIFRNYPKELNDKTKNEIIVLDTLLLHFWNADEEEKLIIFNRIVSQVGVVYSFLNKLTEHFFPSSPAFMVEKQNGV